VIIKSGKNSVIFNDIVLKLIDYYPDVSHTNQINRIKLLLTVAKEKNN